MQFGETDYLPAIVLKTEVGIRNQYCASIVKHFSQDDDLTEKPQKLGRSERITLSVEGNISSGKSTFLNWLMEEPLQVAGICEVSLELEDGVPVAL